MNQLTVRKIANGFIVSTQSTLAAPLPPAIVTSTDTYCPDIAALQAFIAQAFAEAV
jgi:hypothetical protein